MGRVAMFMAFFFSCLLINTAFARNFALNSPQLEEGGRLMEEQVFSGFGYTGKNISPALNWEGAPENTKSFAVTVYDPDAPTGKGWWHWIVFNIPVSVNNLAKNAGNPKLDLAPEGSIQSITDFGSYGYGGAAPPLKDKAHRYEFTLYALDIERLPFDVNTPPDTVSSYLKRHFLAESTITAYYSR